MPQIKVVFTTTEPSAALHLPDAKRQLLVPSSLRRYGLSRILNSSSMLATPAPVPFDFLVNGGTFLRGTLDDYLRENGLSAEAPLTLQYVRSIAPPAHAATFEQDDWVSCVDVLSPTSPARLSQQLGGGERILSGSYDGLVRVWDAAGRVVAASPAGSRGGHLAAVTAARFLSETHIVSGGMDRCVRVWKALALDPASDASAAELKPALELWGHAAPVASVDVQCAHQRILTASADGSVALWSASKKDAPAAPASLLPTPTHLLTSKRRKLSSSAASSSVSTPQRGPLHLMPVHHAPASAAVFDPRDRTFAYSAGQDRTVRTLDLTTGRAVAQVTTSHPLLSLCAMPGPSGLLAAGTSARHIAMVDPRASVPVTSVLTLRGHANKVVGLAAGTAHHALVSASHDGTCRVWDLRSVRRLDGNSVCEPVYTIERESRAAAATGKRRPVAGEGVKVLGVAWDETVGIVSAGEDRRVQINRSPEVGAA